jgi:hypothetical protein
MDFLEILQLEENINQVANQISLFLTYIKIWNL